MIKSFKKFRLKHEDGKLYVVAKDFEGNDFIHDATEYFNNENDHDKWLDYRIGLNDERIAR